MPSDDIDYQRFVRRALRDVVRQALAGVAEGGLPGDHHFFITFRTDDPEVDISPALASAHPEEMTIILQHEFRDLVVDPQRFSVTLRFGGRPERLAVPYSALTSFVDPAAEFGLQWHESAEEELEEEGSDDEIAAGLPDGEATVLPFDGARRR